MTSTNSYMVEIFKEDVELYTELEAYNKEAAESASERMKDYYIGKADAYGIALSRARANLNLAGIVEEFRVQD